MNYDLLAFYPATIRLVLLRIAMSKLLRWLVMARADLPHVYSCVQCSPCEAISILTRYRNWFRLPVHSPRYLATDAQKTIEKDDNPWLFVARYPNLSMPVRVTGSTVDYRCNSNEKYSNKLLNRGVILVSLRSWRLRTQDSKNDND
jgi:hypothetical protein